MTNILIENISFAYGSNQVFDGFSAEYLNNKIYGVVGNNATGKSTLLKLIAGNLSYSKGLITYTANNAPLNKRKLNTELSFMAPYINLLPELSAKENYYFLSKMRSQEINNAILEVLLSTFNIKNYYNTPIKKLSTGTINKFKFISNMILPSSFLLFDEVFSNLDQKSTVLVKDSILKYKDKKIIIITSHKEAEIDFCDFYNHL